MFREGFLRIHNKVLCNVVSAICISIGNDHDNSAVLCSSGKASLEFISTISFFSFSCCLPETSTLRIYFSFSLFEFDIILSRPPSVQAADEISCAEFIFLAYVLSLTEVGEQVKVTNRKHERQKGRQSDCVFMTSRWGSHAGRCGRHCRSSTHSCWFIKNYAVVLTSNPLRQLMPRNMCEYTNKVLDSFTSHFCTHHCHSVQESYQNPVRNLGFMHLHNQNVTITMEDYHNMSQAKPWAF